MAFENVSGGGLPGLSASGDLTGSQFLFVIIDGEKTAGLAGAGESADGVLQNKPDSGQAVAAAISGDTSKVVAGAAVAAGALVASNGSGQGITATTGDYILGKCVTAVANSGELMTVQLTEVLAIESIAGLSLQDQV